MSTTSIVATTAAINASVQSSVAAQQAHEANVTACMGYMSTFKAQGATVQEARQYSKCVRLVYPEPVGFTVEISGKALVATCMLAVIVAILLGLYKRSKDRGWIETYWVEILLLFPIMGVVAWAVGWAAYVGIVYLMS